MLDFYFTQQWLSPHVLLFAGMSTIVFAPPSNLQHPVPTDFGKHIRSPVSTISADCSVSTMPAPHQVLDEARGQIQLETRRFGRIPPPLPAYASKQVTSIRQYHVKTWDEKRANRVREIIKKRESNQVKWPGAKLLCLGNSSRVACVELTWRPGHRRLLTPLTMDGTSVATLNAKVRLAEIPRVSTECNCSSI